MSDFGTFLLEHGVASHAEVLAAIDAQQKARIPIGRLALELRVLTSAQVFTVLAHQARQQPVRFGEAAIRLGMLSQHDVDELLLEQRKRTPKLETFLVNAGVLTPAQAKALREAYDHQPLSSPRVPRPELRRAG